MELKGRTGGGSSRQGDEAAGRGALTLEWRLGNGQPLQASERPSGVSSPGLKEASGAPVRNEAAAGETGGRGAERRSARPVKLTELGAGHAGGERSWESGHLEPFSFGWLLSISFQLGDTRNWVCGLRKELQADLLSCADRCPCILRAWAACLYAAPTMARRVVTDQEYGCADTQAVRLAGGNACPAAWPVVRAAYMRPVLQA